ncbi:MAG: 50S ribosomal protein L4 [Bacteroidota bacterium]|nr:50S ribosomal protein L4 [Bacteroidota bacterium]
MELHIYNIEGKDTGRKIKLSEEVFGIEPNEHCVYLDVKQYLANQRQGTHKAKERSEVSYSTKKIVKQKGSGGARHGSIKAGIFVGGGRMFGPRPRDYGFKLNQKTKEVARKSALSAKVKENAITIIEDFNLDEPKTKAYLNILSSLSIDSKKSLFIVGEYNKNIALSGRNLPKSKVRVATELNTYDLVNNEVIVLSESAVKKLNDL